MSAERPKDRWQPAPEPPKPNPFVVEKKEPPFKLDMGGTSEGKNGRLNNEDAFLFDAKRGLLCVADGMGGSRNAGIASKVVIEGLTPDAIKAFKDPRIEQILNCPPDQPLKLHDRIAVENALKEYLAGGLSRRVRQQGGGGDTTAALAKLWTDEAGKRNLTIANVGDSRIYRLRKGRLSRLTRDQSLLEGLLDEGLLDMQDSPIMDDGDVTRRIDKKSVEARAKTSKNFQHVLSFMKEEKKDNITLEDIRHFVMNGMRDLDPPEVTTHDAEPGDMVIAVSDGISDNLTDDEIADTLSQAGDAESAARLLRIRASMRSKDKGHPRHKADDMTAAVMLIG